MYSHFNHYVDTKRLVQTGNKSAYDDHLEGLRGFLATTSPSWNNTGLDRFNVRYQFFTSLDADLIAGDIIIKDNVEYHVRAVLKIKGIRLKHLQCDLEKKHD